MFTHLARAGPHGKLHLFPDRAREFSLDQPGNHTLETKKEQRNHSLDIQIIIQIPGEVWKDHPFPAESH